jgi:hypothetical protein
MLFLLEKLIDWSAPEEFEIVNTYVFATCGLTTQLREKTVSVRS